MLFSKKVNNKGMSLVELICAIGIMGLLGASVAGIMMVSANTYSRGTADVDLQQEVQLLVNQIGNLIQDATEVTSGGTDLHIVKNGVNYDIVHAGGSDEVNLTTGGETQPLANFISMFITDVSEYEENGIVQLYIAAENNGRTFAGNYTVASRNSKVNPTEISNVVKITTISGNKLIMEPLCFKEIPITITGATTAMGVNWELTGANDTSGTKLYVADDPTMNTAITSTTNSEITLKLEIGRNETANNLKLKIKSNQLRSDMLTPEAQVEIDILIRRVNGLDLVGTLDSGTSNANKLKNGAKYNVNVNVIASNPFIDMTCETTSEYKSPFVLKYSLYYADNAVEEPFRYNASSRCFENSTIRVSVKNNDMSTLTDLSDHPISNGAEVHEFYLDTPAASGDLGATYFVVSLRRNLPQNGNFTMTGFTMHTVRKNKAEMCYFGDATLGEENYNGSFTIMANSGSVYDSLLERGTDNEVANFDWGYLKQPLQNSTGVNMGNFDCRREFRYREVYSSDDDGNPTSVGPWSGTLYSSSEYGNAINLRRESLIFDANKCYEVEVIWRIYNRNNNQVLWPKSDTPENQYLRRGIVNPVMVSYSIPGTSFSAVGGSNIELTPGSSYELNSNSITGIYMNYFHAQNDLSYKLQRKVGDSWVDVSRYYDASIEERGSNNYTGFKVKLNRQGEYRVLLLIDHIQTASYNSSQRRFNYYTRNFNDSDNALYDESTGRGIFYYSASYSTDEWKERFTNDYLLSNGNKFNWGNVDVTESGGKVTYSLKWLGFTKTYNGNRNQNDTKFYNEAYEYVFANADDIAGE